MKWTYNTIFFAYIPAEAPNNFLFFSDAGGIWVLRNITSQTYEYNRTLSEDKVENAQRWAEDLMGQSHWKS